MTVDKQLEEETGAVWNNRYVIRKSLGSGASARVWLAFDKNTLANVALKHFEEWKGNERQCKKEIKNLEFLRRQDETGEHVTKMHEVFYHEGRPCLVMDFVDGITLKQEIKNSAKKGATMPIIRKAMQGLLRTFQFLSSDHVDMLHGDVKPDNIIISEDQERVQLIDFGLASSTGKMKKNMYIQSRWYRSPEVLLGLPATAQVDMWSLGCLLVELFVGVAPFRGYDSFDQMMLIVDAIGLPSERMRARCEDITLRKLDELVAVVSLQWEKADREAAAMGKPLETDGERLRRKLLQLRARRPGESEAEREALVDLVSKLLVNDPQDRLTPTEALAHPFVAPPPRMRSFKPKAFLNSSGLQRSLGESSGSANPGSPSKSQVSSSPSRLSSSSSSSTSSSSSWSNAFSFISSSGPLNLTQFLLPASMQRLRAPFSKEQRNSIPAARTRADKVRGA